MPDPFRDDSTALEARAQELEQEIEDARRELAHVTGPHEALAKALAEDAGARRAEADEVTSLARRLREVRATLDRTRGELTLISKKAKRRAKPTIARSTGIVIGTAAALLVIAFVRC